MFDALKFKRGAQDLTTPRIELPKVSNDDATPPMSADADAMQKRAAARGSEASHDIQQRTKDLLNSGKHPEQICFLRQRESHKLLALETKEPPRRALLIYTSPALAHFYVQTKDLPFEVAGVKLDDIAPVAEDWKKCGFDAFIMNLSPHASVFNVMNPRDNLITREQLVFAWATLRTARDWQAQTRLNEFYDEGTSNLGSPEMQRKLRGVLETLRDSGSFDVPFVHWVIALIAGMQKDEPGRIPATATLESFGPDFLGKTANVENEDGMKAWGSSMTTATVGLLAEFGMLKGPDGFPLTSILEMKPIPRD